MMNPVSALEQAPISSEAMLDFERFAAVPLVPAPFPHLIVPGFVTPAALSALERDFPRIDAPGSFPPAGLDYGHSFESFLNALHGPRLRAAIERKFAIDLSGRPSMVTVRGRAQAKDGRIHVDSPSKLITVLIYLNSGWSESGGRLRLLRSADRLDDYVAEVPPDAGTLLAFRVTANSWHGHAPFAGVRRVIQLNWVTDEAVLRHEQARHGFTARLKRLRALLH